MLDEIFSFRIVHTAPAGHQHIEVTDRLTATPQRPGGRDFVDAVETVEVLDQLVGLNFGGIAMSSFTRATAAISKLFLLLPGIITLPSSPPLSAASRLSRRRLAFGR